MPRIPVAEPGTVHRITLEMTEVEEVEDLDADARPSMSSMRGDDADLLIRHDNTFGDPHEDAIRRVFTINGLFYDLDRDEVIDYVGGVTDLRTGVVRTIGEPDVRFREDPVRILRAIKKHWGARVTTVFVRQGHYARAANAGTDTPASDRVIERIGDLINLLPSDFRGPR